MNRTKRSTLYNLLLLFLGITLVTTGLSVFVYFDDAYDFIINTAMTFNPDSEAFRVWRKNDPPLDMDLYIFNWTNPEDIRNKAIKPRFEEIGPYRFKEVKEKINITWHDHNHTISFRHKKSYYFDPENSVRNLSDSITIINIVPLTIAYMAKDYGFFAKRALSYSLSSFSTLYVTKTAGEILFDGYEDKVLSMLSIIPLTGIKDKFGLFYGKNDTEGDDGVFSMYTNNDANFGKIATWNYRKHVDYFHGQCNDVKGSAGEFYPINQKRDYLELFSPELCKHAKLEYEKDVDIKGVKGYKYTAKNLFDNGTLRPENACFNTGDFLPSGVFNVSECRQGSPTFLSFPHFYNADPYYTDAIEGVKPEDRHEFYITLEPKSAIVIDIGAKMQLNVLLQPVDGIAMYEDVPKIFFPIFYFDQVITVTDDLASSLILIQNLPEIGTITSLILGALGVISFVWVALNLFCCNGAVGDENGEKKSGEKSNKKNDYNHEDAESHHHEVIPLRTVSL